MQHNSILCANLLLQLYAETYQLENFKIEAIARATAIRKEIDACNIDGSPILRLKKLWDEIHLQAEHDYEFQQEGAPELAETSKKTSTMEPNPGPAQPGSSRQQQDLEQDETLVDHGEDDFDQYEAYEEYDGEEEQASYGNDEDADGQQHQARAATTERRTTHAGQNSYQANQPAYRGLDTSQYSDAARPGQRRDPGRPSNLSPVHASLVEKNSSLSMAHRPAPGQVTMRARPISPAALIGNGNGPQKAHLQEWLTLRDRLVVAPMLIIWWYDVSISCIRDNLHAMLNDI